MKLEFDSVEDLQHFLDFLDCEREARGTTLTFPPLEPIGERQNGTRVYSDGTTVTGTASLPDLSPAQQDARALQQGDTSGVHFDTPPGDSAAEVNAAGKPMRKRRTKVEIAADAERIAAVAAAAAVADANREEHGAEAAAAYAKTETPTGANPFAVAPGDTAQAPAPTDAERMKARALELAAGGAADASTSEGEPEAATATGEVSVIEHLNIARGFIATHGMPKYNESFTLCGLDANVMAYTAEQRKAHAEALTKLGVAG